MAIFAKNTTPCKKESDTQVANILTYSSQSMNLQIFRQFLDSPNGASYYVLFYQKYRKDFKKILGTIFAHPRYKDIDPEPYFKKEFLLFIKKELMAIRGEQTNGQTPQDDNKIFINWVNYVGRKKAEAAKHEINKYLIKELVNAGGPENWIAAYDLIPIEYDITFYAIAIKYFDNVKYKGRKKEIKEIIKTLFFLYRLKSLNRSKSEKKDTKVEKFEGWLFLCLKNLVNNSTNRKEIDEELGLDHYDTNIPLPSDDEDNDKEYDDDVISDYIKRMTEIIESGDVDPVYASEANGGANYVDEATENNMDSDGQDGENHENSPSVDVTGKSESKKTKNADSEDPEFLDLIPNSEKQEAASDSALEAETEPKDRLLAKIRVERYLSLIPSSDNAEVLRLIFLQEMKASEVAEELGISIDQVYNKKNRGIIDMIQVALPDIRRHFKKMFEFYGLQLKDMEMREMAELYCENWSVEGIAMKFQKTEHITSEKLAKAYNELLKISIKESIKSKKESIKSKKKSKKNITEQSDDPFEFSILLS